MPFAGEMLSQEPPKKSWHGGEGERTAARVRDVQLLRHGRHCPGSR